MNEHAARALEQLLKHMESEPPSTVTADLFLKLLEREEGTSADEALVEDLKQLQRDMKALQTLVGMSRLK